MARVTVLFHNTKFNNFSGQTVPRVPGLLITAKRK